jgi:hypothetical protein
MTIMKNEHDHLETMVTALDASPTCFERPVCRGFTGDWQITGKLGHVLADGDGYLLYVSTEESARRWTNVKDRLISFCRLTQDGDDEGCLHLDRLPTPDGAAIIREALGIRKRRHLSPEEAAAITRRLERFRYADKPASNGAGLSPEADPMSDSLEEAETN